MKKTQTFNDGLCTIYEVSNIAPRAEKPIEALSKKIGPLRYYERTVGFSRYQSMHQMNVKVDKVLRVLKNEMVSTQDVAVLENGAQYSIKQVQYPEDVMPKVMDLSLERVMQKYDIS